MTSKILHGKDYITVPLMCEEITGYFDYSIELSNENKAMYSQLKSGIVPNSISRHTNFIVSN